MGKKKGSKKKKKSNSSVSEIDNANNKTNTKEEKTKPNEGITPHVEEDIRSDAVPIVQENINSNMIISDGLTADNKGENSMCTGANVSGSDKNADKNNETLMFTGANVSGSDENADKNNENLMCTDANASRSDKNEVSLRKWGQLPEVESSDDESDSDSDEEIIYPYLDKKEVLSTSIQKEGGSVQSNEVYNDMNTHHEINIYEDGRISGDDCTAEVLSPPKPLKAYPTEEEVRIFHPGGDVPERIASVKTNLESRIAAVREAQEEAERVMRERRRSVESIEWSYLKKKANSFNEESDAIVDVAVSVTTNDTASSVNSTEVKTWAPISLPLDDSASDDSDSDDDQIIVPKHYGNIMA